MGELSEQALTIQLAVLRHFHSSKRSLANAPKPHTTMTTLETIVQELQHVPPQHLDEVYQLVHSLSAKAEANKKLAAETMRILSGTDDLPAETWAEIEAYQKRLRAELFTRPNPFLDDEADAA